MRFSLIALSNSNCSAPYQTGIRIRNKLSVNTQSTDHKMKPAIAPTTTFVIKIYLREAKLVKRGRDYITELL